MSIYFTTWVTRMHLKADGVDETTIISIEPEEVRNDQTMHQFFSDKVIYSLTVDGRNLTEKSTEGPFLFDAVSGLRSITITPSTIGSFVLSNAPTSLVRNVRNYTFVLNVSARLRG